MKEIQLRDCTEIAKRLGIEPELILAVARVESGNDINDWLFEPHVFSRLTGHHYDQTHPTTSYPIWDVNKYPPTKIGRQIQFDIAVSLDSAKAYESTSWGLFQIMGYHYKLLNYTSAVSMAADLKAGIPQNVKAFGKMVKFMNLIEVLQNRDWKKFASLYNGPGYRLHNYDIKIAAEYHQIIDSGKASA